MTNNMRSTLITGEYLDNIMDTTLDEIIKALSGIFGPKGTNMFISTSRDNRLYFTRDGKEVFNSLYFDNVLAEQIKNVIGQAVNSQADLIGDSTTTVGLITCHVIKELRETLKNVNFNRFDAKKTAKKIIAELKADILLSAKEIEYGDNAYKSLIYTTTGDTKFIDTILNNIPEIRSDSIIDVQLNEMVAETVFEISGVPKIKTSLLYSKKPLNKEKNEEYYKLRNAAVLFVDGSLALSKYQTAGMLSMLSIYGVENVVIFCASMDKSTTDTFKHYQNEFIATLPEPVAKALSNIVVLRLPEYMNLSRDEIVDLNAIVYDDARDNGINKYFDFEHKIYHALYKIFSGDQVVSQIRDKKNNPVIDSILTVEDYLVYDGDEELITIIENTLLRVMDIQVSNTETILPKMESPAKNSRIEKINEALKNTRSTLDKISLTKRLSRFYSSKIIVKIGAEILASAQNEVELLLDALKASQRALDHGVIYTNGLTLLENLLEEFPYDSVVNNSTKFKETFVDLLQNIINDELLNKIYQDTSQYGKIFINDEYHVAYKDEEKDLILFVVEPVDAIIKVLDAVELGIDIAFSEVFTSKGFLSNYI